MNLNTAKKIFTFAGLFLVFDTTSIRRASRVVDRLKRTTEFASFAKGKCDEIFANVVFQTPDTLCTDC